MSNPPTSAGRATTPPQPTQVRTPPTPSKKLCVYHVLPGPDVTDDHLKLCATLFSNNYGIWASDVSPPLKPGGRVRMSASKLRKECLADPENTLLVLCYVQDEVVGHAFATKWRYKDSLIGVSGFVGWVTQLVVHVKQRRRLIASSMLQMLKLADTWFADVTMLGMVSSHPAACNALCKLPNGDTRHVNLPFIVEHASAVLECSSIKYLRDAQLRGAFLGIPGGSYSAFTSFFVDHAEPQAVLDDYIEKDKWSFGELLDGHEFLILVPVPGTAI